MLERLNKTKVRIIIIFSNTHLLSSLINLDPLLSLFANFNSNTNPLVMSTVVAASRNVEVVFEKLLSKDFENYMQTYSIVLGHDSKKSTINVDVNLFSLGGSMHISHHYACIFYDFAHRRFAF